MKQLIFDIFIAMSLIFNIFLSFTVLKNQKTTKNAINKTLKATQAFNKNLYEFGQYQIKQIKLLHNSYLHLKKENETH